MNRENEVRLREKEIGATGETQGRPPPPGATNDKQKESWLPKKTTSTPTGQMTLGTSYTQSI